MATDATDAGGESRPTAAPTGAVRVTRAIEFSASLRYSAPGLSPEQNRERFGREADQHGHNYRLEVTLEGVPDPMTGMFMNLTDLKALLEREVMSRFDHKDLNDDTDFFDKVPPTPEQLALVIAGLLRSALPSGMLERIRLYPDPENYVEVVEERA